MKNILFLSIVVQLLLLTTGCTTSTKSPRPQNHIPLKVHTLNSDEFNKKLMHYYNSAIKSKNARELISFLNSTINNPKLKLNIRREAYTVKKMICPQKGGIIDKYSDKIGLGLSVASVAPTPLKPILGGASVGLDLCQEDYMGAVLGVGAMVNPLLVPVDITSQVIKMKFFH